MALTLNPDELWRMSLGWSEARDSHLAAAEEVEKSILSRWYNREAMRSQVEPRNRGFGYMTLLLPHLVQTSPRWLRQSDGTILGERIAEGSAAALTQLHAQQRLHQVLRPCAWDYGTAWCMARVDFTDDKRRRPIGKKLRKRLRAPLGLAGASTPTPNQFEIAGAPVIKPIDCKMGGWDTLAKTWPEVRAFFHDARYDISDLEYLASVDSSWNRDLIQKLIQETDWKRLGYAGDPGVHGEELVLRKQVVIREFWIPEAVLPQGAPNEEQHGVIVTVINLGVGGKIATQNIRKPRYWEGHHSGPYAVAGMYQPSASTFPLSRLVASKDSTDMVNQLANASARRMMKQKRVYLADGAVLGEARKANRAPDQTIVGVTGLFNGEKPMIVPVDFGGLGTQDVQMMQWAIADNDEALGLMAAQRGATGQSKNATEVAVASQAYDLTLKYAIEGFENFHTELGVKAFHFVVRNRRFFTHLDADGKRRVRELEAAHLVEAGELDREDVDEYVRNLSTLNTPWQGGAVLEPRWEGDLDPSALGVKLEAGSTGGERDVVVKQAEAEFTAALFQLVQVQSAAPWIDMTQQFRDLGRAYGKPGLERWIDKAKREQMLQIPDQPRETGAFGGFGQNATSTRSGPIVRPQMGGGNQMTAAANAGQLQGPGALAAAEPQQGSSSGLGM